MPGALEVLRALGDLHVQARTVQSALRHCLGVPFVAPSRLQRRGGGDRKQALQSALGLDGPYRVRWQCGPGARFASNMKSSPTKVICREHWMQFAREPIGVP